MTPAREPWVDAAKGVLILLVVLWHVVRKHYLLLPWVPEEVAHAWSTGSFLLQPVRVPLFFVVSGLLAARAVHRPWPDLLRTRVLRDYWTYLVWLLLGSAFFLVGPHLTTRTARSAEELVVAALTGTANTWYLYALAAYVLVARLTLHLPLWLPLTGAAVLAVVADLPGSPHTGNVEPLLRDLLPFLVAVRRPDLVTALVARSDGGRALLAVAVYLPVASLAVAAGASRLAGVAALLGGLGAVCGTVVAVAAARALPRAAEQVGRLGRLTLPVYVLHLPLLALLHAGALHVDLPPAVGVVWPLVAVALLTGASLLLHRLLVGVGLEVLFRPPRVRPLASAPC